MFTSGSENTSWEYVPPKKLQTTLLSDSPHALKEISGNTWRHPDQHLKKFPSVTPKDNTRTNSPIQMPSTIFSDEDENEEIRGLYEHLVLIRDRHLTLKTYVNSIRAQLQQSLNLAIADLQGKRNGLMSRIDLLYDQEFEKISKKHKEKEERVVGKERELEGSLEEIEGVIQRIEICGGEGERIGKTIENTLKIWVSENEVSGDWALLEIPDFDYEIVSRKKERLQENGHKVHHCSSKKHRKHRNDSQKIGNSRNSSYKTMDRPHVDIEERVQKLEKAAFRPPRAKKLLESVLDLGRSESPISISTLYSDSSDISCSENQLKVYIPQGYPSYTCFYLIRVASEVTLSQVLEKLTLHMGLPQEKFCLKLGQKDSKADLWKKAVNFAKFKLYLDKI